MQQKALEKTIIQSIQELQYEGLVDKDLSLSPETELYGPKGILTSLNLVTLVVDLEEVIASDYGKNITLTHEKTFSVQNSPFKTIANLAGYISELISQDE